MLGSLIGAAGSVLGGLLGGEEKTKGKNKTWTSSATRSKVHLKQLVSEAEKAGFNPLTILRAGGLSAYTDTFSKSFSKSKTKGSSSSSTPLGAGIAAAANTLGGAIENMSSPAAGAAQAWNAPPASLPAAQAEYNMVKRALSDVQPGTLGTQPRLPASSTWEAKTPALSGAATDGSGGQSMQPTFEAPTITNPWPRGWGVQVNPGGVDAEAFETHFGDNEITSMIGTVVVAGNDLWHNGKRIYNAMSAPGGDLSAKAYVTPNRMTAYKAQQEADALINSVNEAGKLWHNPALGPYATPIVEKIPIPPLTGQSLSW